MVSQTQNLVIAGQERGPRGPNKLPLYKTMLYTFQLSVGFLWRNMRKPVPLEVADDMLYRWAKKIFNSGDATLKVVGLEKLEPGRAYVVMSNHRSLLDIPAIFAAWPGHLRMVLKEELTRVPIWGRALKASGFIPIDRRKPRKAIEQLDLAKQRIAEGVNVWIAPEGTRSRDGSLGRFKKGGFHLASQLDVAIVPVWIEGTDTIIPPDQFVVHYGGEVTVHIGEPIAFEGREVSEMMEIVRENMVALGR